MRLLCSQIEGKLDMPGTVPKILMCTYNFSMYL